MHPAESPNLYGGEFDEQPGKNDHPGFGSRRRFVGRRAGAQRLGASLWEVPPGEAAYPYHLHRGGRPRNYARVCRL